MSDEAIYWALSVLGLSAGFAGLAWGYFVRRARKRRAAEVARRIILSRRVTIEIPHPRDWPVYDPPAEEKENGRVDRQAQSYRWERGMSGAELPDVGWEAVAEQIRAEAAP